MKKILKRRNARKKLRNFNKKMNIIKKVSQNGKIFSVEFIKKNGDVRKMTVRKGVTKFLRGGGYNTVSHLPQYMTLFSINDNGYRNLNLHTLFSIKGDGKEYTF